MSLWDFMPDHTGQYSAGVLATLYSCLAVYSLAEGHIRPKFFGWAGLFALSAVGLGCSVAAAVGLITRPGLLGASPGATVGLIVVGAVLLSCAACLVIEAFVLRNQPQPWLRLTAAFAMLGASSNVFLTIFSYIVRDNLDLRATVLRFEWMSRGITFWMLLIVLVWFVVSRIKRRQAGIDAPVD